MTPRCAIYARYSSDRQNERSIADQVTLCSRHAEAKGWTVGRFFSDAAISGSAMANRPGLLDALAAAERGEFDILLVEDTDRLARNREHDAHVFNRLDDAGVAIATVTTEKVTVIESALKGLMNELYIVQLKAKTSRGMRANAEKGLATGARLYGYRSQPGGQVDIIEAEAEVIRRIFADYAKGETAREIAGALNAEDVPSPRGGQWNASTIAGNTQRGNGVLNTELYVGVKAWGRDQVRKDRSTGRRSHRYLPPEQWKRTPVPHLRIVDDATWAAVRARKRQASAAPQQAQRRPGLFSGLLKCGDCGASYTSYTTGKLVCAAFREKKTCTNSRMPKREAVERHVLATLQEEMLSPAAVTIYVRAYHRAAQARKADVAARRSPLTRRLAEVERGMERAVDAILRGVATATMEARLGDLEREKADLEGQIAAIRDEPDTIDLHPRAAEAYGEMIAQLQATLADYARGETAAQRQLVAAVRAVISRIVIQPLSQQRGAPIDIIVEGTLAELTNERLGNLGRVGVVAGASYTHSAPYVPLRFRSRLQR